MAPKRSAPKAKAAAREAPPAAAADEENFESWSVAKLKARLQELGGTATGGKPALVERLKALTAAAASAAAPAGKAAAKRGAAKAKAAEPSAPAPSPPKRAAPPAASASASASSSQEAPAAKRAKASAKGAATKELKATPSEPAEEEPAVKISGPTTIHFEDGDFSAEYAKSSRSECKKCKVKIMQGSLRIGKQMKSDKFDGMYSVWKHWECLLQEGCLPRTTQLIAGFSMLKPEDQDMISKKVPATAEGGAGGAGEGDSEEIKAQNKRVFEVVDSLNKLSDGQIKEMLEANEYPSQKLGGQTATKVHLCADGILFGACAKCDICGGAMLLTGEGYRCRGWVNEYLKCTFKTQTPGRSAWTLTEAAKKVLGRMKLTTGDRLFAAAMRDDDEIAASQEASQKRPVFLGMTMVVLEKGDTESKAKLEEMIKSNGGSVADAVAKAADCVITHSGLAPEEEDEGDEDIHLHPEVAKAKQLSVVGLNEDFVKDSVETGELQDMAEYLLFGQVKKRREIKEAQTSKFIEKMGVSMDSDVGELAQTAHVLVDRQKKRVYSEMLTRTDLVSGSNSFYTLHLLESDDVAGRKYWVFRKWGRIGVSQGGTKLEEYHSNQSAAIRSFEKQYNEKTGNKFGEQPFQVKKGLFVRVEMEHKALAKKGAGGGGEGDSAGVEKGGGDQPLGKLSKAQIEKGDAVLDKVEALINKGDFTSADPVVKAKATAEFTAFSAEYYTMIPHNFGAKKPPTINNSELLGSEKALLQFYLRMGFEEMDADDEKLAPIAGVMELKLPSTLVEAANMVCGPKDIKQCTSKGTTMHKKKAGKPHTPMTPDLYGAILLYTSNAIYKQLNKALRDEDRTTVERYFPYLRMLFEACARLPQQTRTLWRGVGVDLFPTYKVGSTIVWWGVSSCTSDEKVARNFMAGCGAGATLLTVETKTACDIAEVSFYANEAECILLPGTQLEVISSKKVGAKSEIALREVGRVVN